MNPYKSAIAERTNLGTLKGELKELIVKRDMFIGVSVANVLTEEMVLSMNPNPIIFALANPIPEVIYNIINYIYLIKYVVTYSELFIRYYPLWLKRLGHLSWELADLILKTKSTIA